MTKVQMSNIAAKSFCKESCLEEPIGEMNGAVEQCPTAKSEGVNLYNSSLETPKNSRSFREMNVSHA